MIIFTLNLTIENEILEENTQTCSSKMSRSKSSDIQSLLIQYPFGYFATSVQLLVWVWIRVQHIQMYDNITPSYTYEDHTFSQNNNQAPVPAI